jgi:hypothetical protein
MEENKYLPWAQIPEMNNNYNNYFTCNEVVNMMADAEDEIKELKEQNKKLIEAVKESIDELITIELIIIESGYEIFGNGVSDNISEVKIMLQSIISEIKEELSKARITEKIEADKIRNSLWMHATKRTIEFGKQNKKLIEAVKGLIDRSILPLQVTSAHEAKDVKEFVEQKNKVLSIISEIEGE